MEYRVPVLEQTDSLWKDVPILSSRLGALESRRLPWLEDMVGEMRCNIKELQRLALMPAGYSLKAARSLGPDIGTDHSPATRVVEATAHVETPEDADDPAGFEGLAVAEASVNESTVHGSIRERIGAIELRLRETIIYINAATPLET